MRNLTLAALVLLAPLAHAGDTPENIVKYRHNLMESLGKSMKMSAMIAKNEMARPEDMKAHAASIAAYATLVKGLFPEGTEPGKVESEAKAEIWSDRAGFDKASDLFVEKANAFVKAAESGDAAATMKAFGEVGKSCGGCHDDYKVDDDH